MGIGWCVVHVVERIERIKFLDHGHGSKESAVEWAREYIRKNPGEAPDDIFILENVNEPDKRYCFADEFYKAAGIPVESE